MAKPVLNLESKKHVIPPRTSIPQRINTSSKPDKVHVRRDKDLLVWHCENTRIKKTREENNNSFVFELCK